MFEPVIKDLGMDPLILRKEWILDQERSFARELARIGELIAPGDSAVVSVARRRSFSLTS